MQKLKTIAEDPRFQKTPENPLGSYHFSDLKYNIQTDANNNNLQLPDMTTSVRNYDFNLDSSSDIILDIRNISTTIGEEMKDVMLPNASPADFYRYITEQIKDVTDNNIKDWVNFVVYVENKLRDIVDMNKIDSLGDKAKYPLLIWVLLMNPPATPVSAVPIPVPPKQVQQELAAISGTIPA